MPAYRKISGAWHSGIFWRKIGGVWKKGILYKRIGGVWKIIAGQLTALAAPDNVSGVGDSGGVRLVTSDASTVTVTGGVGSLSYSWTYVGGTVLTVTSPTGASTAFSKSLAIGGSANATYKCVVTDAGMGLTADSNIVSINLSN